MIFIINNKDSQPDSKNYSTFQKLLKMIKISPLFKKQDALFYNTHNSSHTNFTGRRYCLSLE